MVEVLNLFGQEGMSLTDLFVLSLGVRVDRPQAAQLQALVLQRGFQVVRDLIHPGQMLQAFAERQRRRAGDVAGILKLDQPEIGLNPLAEGIHRLLAPGQGDLGLVVIAFGQRCFLTGAALLAQFVVLDLFQVGQFIFGRLDQVIQFLDLAADPAFGGAHLFDLVIQRHQRGFDAAGLGHLNFQTLLDRR